MKILKNRKISLIIIVVLGLSASAVYYLLRPIKNSELIAGNEKLYESYYTSTYEYCFKPSPSLISRCGLFKGEIRAEMIYTDGIDGNFRIIGCFPKSRAFNGDKYCESNSDCQGYCVRTHYCSAELPEGSCNSCSRYKKPFFVYKKSPVKLLRSLVEKKDVVLSNLIICDKQGL